MPVLADVYVSPMGNDTFSGRIPAVNSDNTDGPVATLKKAQQIIHTLRAEYEKKQSQTNITPSPVKIFTVALKGGVYYLSEPLMFTSADSNTAWCAYSAEDKPILSGGVLLTGWKVEKNGHWTLTIPEVRDGKWYFSQLFVNNTRRERPILPARIPKPDNSDLCYGPNYYQIAGELPPSEKSAGRGADCFTYANENIRAIWTNMTDIEICVFHKWSTSRMKIQELDTAKKKILFTGCTRNASSWGKFTQGARYYIENVKEALTSPGQWYLDRPTGTLTYIPFPGETLENTQIIAPRLEQLLFIMGDPTQKLCAENICFNGLAFYHTNWNLSPQGQSFPQAEIGLSSTAALSYACRCVFCDCAFSHGGGYGIAFGEGCKTGTLQNCVISDMAGGGVMIGRALCNGSWKCSPQTPPNPDVVTSHITVENCTLAHLGQLHPAAVGIWIGHSSDNVIKNNDIYDLYYSGISLGWVWGYRDSIANRNEVGYNKIYKIGQAVLSDMGGVYTLGYSEGTRVHHNVIHDVDAFSYGGWGLYTDEGTEKIRMDSNLIYRTKTGSFHQHYGKENVIENNIMVHSRTAQIQRTRTEPHTSFFFQKNIIYWENDSPLLSNNWRDNHFKLDFNLYWNNGKPITFIDNLTLTQWRQQYHQDEHSIIADPLFINAAKDDYRLKPESPALKIGFQPFNPEDAGRKTQGRW